MRDLYERLRDVQEAITHIMKYTNQGSDLFYQDELVQIGLFIILRLLEKPCALSLKTSGIFIH